MTEQPKPIAISAGEPAGIGPDIILKTLLDPPSFPLQIFADPDCLQQRAAELSLPKDLIDKHPHIEIKPVQLKNKVIAGDLDTANAPAVLECIRLAAQACIKKECRALVTAPVHKGIINDANIKFSGHTEFLAELTDTTKTVMLLASDQLKVALATTHLPLAKVPKAITEASLTRCIEIIDHDLQTYFHISSPKILVCGLNPHAGESGHLGDEEIRVIIPTLEKLRKNGYQVIGPVSADTAFTKKSLENIDVVLAMYHDQGLPVIKTLSFGETINITLGLPIIRTSVDHGIALDIAGTGQASEKSLKAAIHYADIL